MRYKVNHQENIGKKFNRLLVLDVIKHRYSKKKWAYSYICKCDCGKVKDIRTYFVLNGYAKSCGCLQSENSREQARKMGLNTRQHEEKCDYCGADNHYAHGLCRNCYTRYMRNGSPEYKKEKKSN